MREHCAHARFVWNLGHEQRLMYRAGRGRTPSYLEQSRQLAEARAAEPWLAAGAHVVQQQALRDLDEAWRYFFSGKHRKPTWRKAFRKEGFRITGKLGRDWKLRRLSKHVGEVWITKIGWVRFRWSRAVPPAKSFRVTVDGAGRWHIGFAAWPAPATPGPGIGEVVGIDRGIAVSAALSTGEMLHCPGLSETERARILRLERKSARQRIRGQPASSRLDRTYRAVAKLRARATDRRKDWVEKVSTDIARRFDVIRVEDLKVRHLTRSARGSAARPGRNVRQKSVVNRAILSSGWAPLVCRLEDKAPGRAQKINPRYTSQRCSECGRIAAENRKSQAVFACVACTYTGNADVNAAKNIAAGHAVTARGGPQLGPLNREPQLALLSA